jgi:hypothetical protein
MQTMRSSRALTVVQLTAGQGQAYAQSQHLLLQQWMIWGRCLPSAATTQALCQAMGSAALVSAQMPHKAQQLRMQDLRHWSCQQQRLQIQTQSQQHQRQLLALQRQHQGHLHQGQCTAGRYRQVPCRTGVVIMLLLLLVHLCLVLLVLAHLCLLLLVLVVAVVH